MKTVYLAAAAAMLLLSACQPYLPAGTIVAIPQPPPPPPPTYAIPNPYIAPEPYIAPVVASKPRYNYYVKGRQGNWAQKRCPLGMHWQASHRVLVKPPENVDGVYMTGPSRVVPGRCVRT